MFNFSGDNIFHSEDFYKYLNKAIHNLQEDFSTILGIDVDNPNDFGVIETDENKNLIKIVEKPKNTNSKTIVSGLYFYTNKVVEFASKLRPSLRERT